MYQVVWYASFCRLSTLQKRQRRRLCPFGVGPQEVYISISRFSMTFARVKNVKKSFCHDRQFSGYRQK